MKNPDTSAQSSANDVTTHAAVQDAAPSPQRADALLHELARMSDPSLDDLIEAVIAWSQAAFGTGEIVAAQEQFFVEMGKAFPDDAFYDARMSYFFDWFLFERFVRDTTPYVHVCRRIVEQGIELSESTRHKLTGLGSFRHSLFQILKVQDTSLVVQDLITPAKLTVKAKGAETYRAMEKKNIFQGFLFQLGDVNHISHGIVLHPLRVNSVLKKQLKVAQKSPAFDARAELCRDASLQIRYMRHKHVDPKAIYLAGPKT